MPEHVAIWLHKLGLDQYISNFSDNDIDTDLLLQLTDSDLKELGIDSLGHRKTILGGIRNLGEEKFESTTPETDRGQPEHRQLTVMFSDLVDSTVLSQQLDLEDLRHINVAYQDACKTVIDRYEGYIARYMGDGILAYFGFPKAHEDDPERAILAGLAITREVSSLNESLEMNLDSELAVRVGITTGPVVVGDLIGEAASQENAVVGETPNLAARLQTLASRNSVVVGPGTHDLMLNQFEYEDLGERELKGFSRPIHAWRVVSPITSERRFIATRGDHLTPLVGREHEIGLLYERWEQAKEGEGQVVLLSGEAGIGKSRVAETLLERTEADNPVCLRYQCSPYHTNSILHPVIEQMERAAQITPEDTSAQRFEKFESLLAQANAPLESTVPLLAPLMSVQPGDNYPQLEMTPERQKEETLHALLAHLDSLADGQSLILIYEDVHWVDPTTLALLELVIVWSQRMPVLTIITFRPEFSSPWSSYTHVTSLTLNRLTRSLAKAMVSNVAGELQLPEKVRKQIIEKTDGIPLFVEELTRTVLESSRNAEGAGQDQSGAGPPRVVIPTTLQDSLTARLDRLSYGKQVAQEGGVIGREFSWQLLCCISGLQSENLTVALHELVDSGMLYRRGTGAGASYVFKHALIQEAAYVSLLRSTRRSLHEKIARALLSQFPDIAGSNPELVAYHFTEAGFAEEASTYWLNAGRQAAQRAANLEAIGHLTSGLDTLQTMPDSTDRARRELDFQIELCGPYLSIRGWGGEETAATYARARELCTQLGEIGQLPSVLNGEYFRELTKGRCQSARDVAVELLQFGDKHKNSEAILQGHRLLGWVSLYLGEFSVCRSHVDTALRLYDPDQHGELKLRYAHDTRVAMLCVRTITQCLCGYPDQGKETAKAAIAYAHKIDHEPTLAYAIMYAKASTAIFLNEPENAYEIAGELLLLSERLSSSLWRGYGCVIRGWSACRLNADDDAMQLFREGHELLEHTSPNPWQPVLLSLLAEILVSRGDIERALLELDNALHLVERTGERSWESGIYNQYGQTLLALDSGKAQEAENSFLKGLEVARSQGARTLELRAATSLADLWQDQGRCDQALDLLMPVYNGFSEGFNIPDLVKSKILLDKLNSLR